MEPTGPWLKSSGLGPPKLSPWGFKGLGLLYLSIYLSIDLPLVALIIKASSATWGAYNHLLSLQNPSKIPPEPFQNPSSLCKNRFKIATKTISQAGTRSERAPTSIFGDFLQFSEAPGPSKIDPKSPKSIQNRTKIDVRKNQVSQHYVFSIFRRFGLPKRIQNPDFVWPFSKNSILWKSLRNNGCAQKNQGSDY